MPMIILNINELLKFALDSVANYIGSAIMILLLGVMITGLLVHLMEKLGSVIITIIMIVKGQSATDIVKHFEKTDE